MAGSRAAALSRIGSQDALTYIERQHRPATPLSKCASRPHYLCFCCGSHAQRRKPLRTNAPTAPGQPGAESFYRGAPRSRAAFGSECGVVLVTANIRSADCRVVLFVLGAGRSGTAALTRVLSLCGGALPAGMLGADSGNPLGYWEPRAAVYLNEVILRRQGSAQYDPSLRLHEEGAFDAEKNAACIAKIDAFLNTLPAAPLVVIKDPRITLLSGMWFEAARLAGLDIAAAIAVRHPQEVIASAARKTQVSPELASALWLKYLLLAERDTRGLLRVFVEYANLLDDWRGGVKRISAALGIDLNTDDEGAIENFLKPDLRRQRHCGPVTEPFGTDWISAVYEALRAAARDEPLDGFALDRVFEAYRASEQAYWMVFKDFHRFHKVNRLIPPFALKLVNEVGAIAHQRSGAWA